MARKRIHNQTLPVRLYLKRSKHYYHADRGKWTYLGANYIKALAKYHALEAARRVSDLQFWEVCWQYDTRSLLDFDLTQQVQERRCLYALASQFGKQRIDAVGDSDVHTYFRSELRHARTAAVRQLATFNRLWTWAQR
jgi:hypothetical protein